MVCVRQAALTPIVRGPSCRLLVATAATWDPALGEIFTVRVANDKQKRSGIFLTCTATLRALTQTPSVGNWCVCRAARSDHVMNGCLGVHARGGDRHCTLARPFASRRGLSCSMTLGASCEHRVRRMYLPHRLCGCVRLLGLDVSGAVLVCLDVMSPPCCWLRGSPCFAGFG